MTDSYGKKFVASYSGGKDSTFAIYKAIQAGLKPLELINTYNMDLNRSWFHGMTENLLKKVSASLRIPIKLIRTSGEEYEKNFEQALTEAKKSGAELCVFGDIDIEGHLEWCSLRCRNTGLIPFFPLWKENRRKIVYDFIENGFLTLITVIDTTRVPEEVIGKILDRETADLIEKSGADICGENGEYHTFTFNGPLFKNQIDFSVKETVKRDKYLALNID